jgi:hypothetical protein
MNAAQQYMHAIDLLYHLPATYREHIHDTAKDQRMHLH